jgi:hypothetical protein
VFRSFRTGKGLSCSFLFYFLPIEPFFFKCALMPKIRTNREVKGLPYRINDGAATHQTVFATYTNNGYQLLFGTKKALLSYLKIPLHTRPFISPTFTRSSILLLPSAYSLSLFLFLFLFSFPFPFPILTSHSLLPLLTSYSKNKNLLLPSISQILLLLLLLLLLRLLLLSFSPPPFSSL